MHMLDMIKQTSIGGGARERERKKYAPGGAERQYKRVGTSRRLPQQERSGAKVEVDEAFGFWH